MRITIDSTNVELDETMREYIERRLRFVLTRYSSQVNRISLSVEHSHRPGGGFVACCKVSVKLIPKEEVEFEVHDAEIHSAVARAVDRAGRAVERRFAQQRQS